MSYSKSILSRVGKWFVILIAVVYLTPARVTAQAESPRHHWRTFLRNQQPALSTNFGFTQSSLNGLSQSLASPRTFELKLGGVRIEEPSDGIIEMRNNYFTLANVTNELGSKSNGREINTDLWRFGFGMDKGYGYGSKESPAPSVILQHSSGVHWSKLRVKGPIPSVADSALLSLYDAFRFGTKTEAGVSFRVTPLVCINAGFERSAIFRRHLVWQWFGSVALEGSAQWALDKFIDRVMDASPTAAPVVYFLLKNGLSYGVYQLRKEKMNFPFSSEPPIMNDTFKIGVTFIF